MLGLDDFERWLFGSVEDAADLFAGSGNVEPVTYPVSKEVGNSRNEGPQLIQPVEIDPRLEC